MTIFATAFSLFLISNALGNLPFYLSLLKDYPPKKQKIILAREMFFALIILLAFGFFGNSILHFLGISEGTIGIAGGILLFIIALTLIFPDSTKAHPMVTTQEPFIVPIAIPGMAGSGSVSAVMLYSANFNTHWTMVTVILIAWALSFFVILSAPLIKKVCGKQGLIALERFGGLIIALIAVQLIVAGAINQVKTNFPCKEQTSKN